MKTFNLVYIPESEELLKKGFCVYLNLNIYAVFYYRV